MATSAYYAWRAAGSHWQLAQPITDMVALARRRGITVLGTIGADDESHLQAAFPEDHTPFSRTYWPVQATGWVCACDLANSQGLGAAILRDARAGKLPWLKYMNFGGGHYEHTDGFRARTWSGDEHVHLSCRSDWLTRGIGAYDPFAPPEEDGMAADVDQKIRDYMNGMPSVEPVKWRIRDEAWQKKVDAALAESAGREKLALTAITALAEGGGVDSAPILSALKTEGAAIRTQLTEQHAEEMAALRRDYDAELAGLRAELAARQG